MVNAGRILIMPKGEWDSLTSYNMLDLVTENGVAYLARQASVGQDPATDTTLTYWQPFGTAASIATTSTPGLVMPDGTTITIDNTGLIEVPIDEDTIQIDGVTGKMKAVVNKALNDLTDVTITSASAGQFLCKGSGSGWENKTVYGSDILTGLGGSTLTAAINGKENAPTVLSNTLAAGATTLNFTNAAIGNDSLLDVYTDTYGVNPTAMTQSSTTVTLTFDSQSSAVGVKLVVRN